jgi:hypothetical protein
LPTLIPLDTSALKAGAENASSIPTTRTKKTRLFLIALLLFSECGETTSPFIRKPLLWAYVLQKGCSLSEQELL